MNPVVPPSGVSIACFRSVFSRRCTPSQTMPNWLAAETSAMSGDETALIARSMWFEKGLAYNWNALISHQPNEPVPNR